jgi:DHA1 family tetracycline resistance protein-like MFS transporter
MTLRFATLLFTVTLTAVGIGLSLPVLPQLLAEVGRTSDLGWHYGLYLGTYACVQFFASPVLGRLSDRFGRVPLLVVSAAGAALNYLFLAAADTLALLYVGRVLAGLTGATMAVASAAITDLTAEADRPRRFGQLGAAFGVGFIVGPALGGVLGAWSTRAPFVAAAVLEALNIVFLLVAFRGPAAVPRQMNDAPDKAPLSARSLVALWPLLTAFFLLCLIGEVGGTVWTLYGQDRFRWTSTVVGVSLAGFGLCHAVVQALIVGPVVARVGQRNAFWLGSAADAAAYLAVSQATDGLFAFLLLPLFSLGGIAMPVMQTMLTDRVSEREQGTFQGVLGSLTSLASTVGPAGIALLYFATRADNPGWVWIVGALCYVPCVLLVLRAAAAQSGRSHSA